MATSGITTAQMSRDDLVKAAMRKLQALAKGQVPDAEDYTNGAEAINNLVAEFATLGMPLWAKTTSTIAMVAGQSSYILGVGQPVSMAMPLRIIQAWTTLTTGASKQELNETAAYDFNLLPTASSTSGVPAQYSYEPKVNYGILRIWPAPSAAVVLQRTLTINHFRAFDSFNTGTDTPYFPQVWNNALIYGAANLLAPEFGVPLNDRGMLAKEAKEHLDMALDAGQEWASLYFQPDRRNYDWY